MFTALLSLAPIFTIHVEPVTSAQPSHTERRVIVNTQRYWVDCKTLSQYINKGYGFPIVQYRGNEILVFFTDSSNQRAKEQARKVCAAPEVFR